ncbi:hypothetical protein WS61_11670 [Burkholderia sp. ABCPW 11]|nr:hypothetical protein WS61_11670 [Burkholderia sp. ABCPW 11]
MIGVAPSTWMSRRARARRRLPARRRISTPPGARWSSYAGRASRAARFKPQRQSDARGVVA